MNVSLYRAAKLYACAVTRRELDLIAETRAALADGSARRRRQAARVRQTEVAAALGVAQSSVSQWESGARAPDTVHALAYGRILRRITLRAA